METMIGSVGEMDEFAMSVFNIIKKRNVRHPMSNIPNIFNPKGEKKEAKILALSGNLGSGKTTFVKSLAKALGIKRIVQSPTFVILKSYKLKAKSWKLLIHVDAYRIEKDKELEVLGWQGLIKNPNNLIAIEWPENAQRLIPMFATKINFEFIDEKTRRVTIKV